MIHFKCVYLNRGLYYSVFSKNIRENYISASIAWNLTKLYMKYLVNIDNSCRGKFYDAHNILAF